jgi:hypothetical protein
MIGNRWFLAGAVIAVAFEVPDLWWQAQHGWATIAMTQALHRENGGLANIGTWVAGQLAVVTLALARVWLAGLRFLWQSDRPLWQAMAWAYGLLFVLFAVTTGAQTYYLGAAYVYLLAAGAVAIDRWLQARPAAQSPAGQCAHHRGGRPACLACAPGGRHRLDVQDQQKSRRDRRLAPGRAHR